MSENSPKDEHKTGDPVVEAFRKDIDVTLLEANLRLTVEERFLKLMELQRFATELRRAGRKAAAK